MKKVMTTAAARLGAVAALVAAGFAIPASADAPTPVKAAATEQPRSSHAKDWRAAAKDMVAAMDINRLAGKSIAVAAEMETPFLRAFVPFVAAELHSAGVTVKSAGADVVLTVATQRVDHASRNGYSMLSPVPNTAAAVGAVAVKEILSNSLNFNVVAVTAGVLTDVARAVERQQELDELVVTATAEGAVPFNYAAVYYVPGNEAFNYRDSGLRAAVLKVNPAK